MNEELRIRHGNGTFGKWLIQLAKTDVLLLDDWGMAGIDNQTRADLLEIIDDGPPTKPPSSPASYRLSIGMPGWGMPPLSMPFWTV